jgi:hypothetical protein
MRRLILAAILVLCLVKTPILAMVDPVESTQVESGTLKIQGTNIDSASNPLSISLLTVDGNSYALNSILTGFTKGKKGKQTAEIALPSVANDTKVILRISGGDVSSSQPQEFVLLILDKPKDISLSPSDTNPVRIPAGTPSGTGSTDIKGDKGDKGEKGDKGDPGPSGPMPTAMYVDNVIGLGSMAKLTAPSGVVVGTTDVQTISNKTLLSPIIPLTGFVSNGGVSDTDTMFSALQKLAVNSDVHQASITSNTTNIAANTSSINTLTSDLATNNSAITSLSSSLANNTTAINTLNTNVASNTSAISNNAAAIVSANNIINGKQNASAALSSIAALTTSANKLIYANGSNSYATADLSPLARTLLAGTNGSEMRSTLGISGSTNILTQTLDGLVSNGGISSSDTVLSGFQTLAIKNDIQAVAIAANAANIAANSVDIAANTIGIAANTASISGKQNASAALSSIAGLSTSANKMIYATASDTYSTTDLSPFARTLIDDADASAMRFTLGLGSIATQAAPTGTVVGTSDTQTLDNKTLGNGTKVALGSDAQGDVYYRDNSGSLTRVAIGSAGTALQVNPGATAPQWTAMPIGVVYNGTIDLAGGSSVSINVSGLNLIKVTDSANGSAPKGLATLSNGVTGQMVTLIVQNTSFRILDDGENGGGNIKLSTNNNGSKNFNNSDVITFIYDGTNWLEYSRSENP